MMEVKSCDEARRQYFIEVRHATSHEHDIEEIINAVQGYISCEDESIDVNTELFRMLRNLSVDANFTSSLMSSKKLWCRIYNMFYDYLSKYEDGTTYDEQFLVLLRVIVQFLGNLSSGNSLYRSDVWHVILPKLRTLLCGMDIKISCYSSMMIYNCLLDDNNLHKERVEELLKSNNFKELVEKFALLTTQQESEFSLYILQRLLLDESETDGSVFLKLHFTSFTAKVRLIILDILLEMVDKEHDMKWTIFSKVNLCSSLSFVSEHLQQNMTTILNPANVNDNQNVIELCRCLELLCTASANEHVQHGLKNDDGLMESALHTLRLLVSLGKSSEVNEFTPRQSLDSFTNEASFSPTDGFKKNVIRLIANLCYDSPHNQNKVRKLDGIYIILDSCSLDSHNPYITQWCVFAIRNLCHNNLENQHTIAQIQAKGTVLPSPILEELKIRVVTQ